MRWMAITEGEYVIRYSGEICFRNAAPPLSACRSLGIKLYTSSIPSFFSGDSL